MFGFDAAHDVTAAVDVEDPGVRRLDVGHVGAHGQLRVLRRSGDDPIDDGEPGLVQAGVDHRQHRLDPIPSGLDVVEVAGWDERHDLQQFGVEGVGAVGHHGSSVGVRLLHAHSLLMAGYFRPPPALERGIDP
ncbi:MAG: hypothetical protein ACR2MB_05840 [Acidimicrobiales bacterium]